MDLWYEVRPATMLRVVAPYVAEMLHLKSLTINVVAGVAGFQTISTCKSNFKSLNINMLACVFGCFSHAPFTLNSEFCTARFVPCPVARRSAIGRSPGAGYIVCGYRVCFNRLRIPDPPHGFGGRGRSLMPSEAFNR